MKRILSIDPGSHTGYVIVDFPIAPGLDIVRAQLVGSGVIYPPKPNAEESLAERDVLMIIKISNVISDFRPSLVVLEEPSDAANYWGRESAATAMTENNVLAIARGDAPKQSKKGMARGTLFRLGVYYGLALGAVAHAKNCDVVSYPVQGTRQRPGWMGHGARRVNVLREMRFLYANLARKPVIDLKVSEHELMALGVLNYHASQLNLTAPRGTKATA